MTTEELDTYIDKVIENSGSLAANEEIEGEYEIIDEDEQAYIDVREAIGLFEEVKTVVDYIKNPEIIKSISKRERAVLDKISERMRVFLANTYTTYMEEPEEQDS